MRKTFLKWTGCFLAFAICFHQFQLLSIADDISSDPISIEKEAIQYDQGDEDEDPKRESILDTGEEALNVSETNPLQEEIDKPSEEQNPEQEYGSGTENDERETDNNETQEQPLNPEEHHADGASDLDQDSSDLGQEKDSDALDHENNGGQYREESSATLHEDIQIKPDASNKDNDEEMRAVEADDKKETGSDTVGNNRETETTKIPREVQGTDLGEEEELSASVPLLQNGDYVTEHYGSSKKRLLRTSKTDLLKARLSAAMKEFAEVVDVSDLGFTRATDKDTVVSVYRSAIQPDFFYISGGFTYYRNTSTDVITRIVVNAIKIDTYVRVDAI